DWALAEKSNRTFSEEQVKYLIRIFAFGLAINVFVTALFIDGAKNENSAKMEYFVVVVGLNAMLLITLWNIVLIVFAV
ncbi:hypothetical protein Bhyg_14664, partial [Pseudolycoriella hygida]